MSRRLRLPPRVVFALANAETRVRVRLHQAANRMEDADPLDVALAEHSVRAFDAIDKVTGFRRDHRARVVIPSGVSRPAPPPPGADWAGPLDPSALSTRARARLRQRWQRVVAASDDPAARAAAVAAWREEIDRVSSGAA